MSDRPIEYTEGVKRFEDMSPKGFLKLQRDGDGDVLVTVHGTDMTNRYHFATVEFCVGPSGGGQSTNTALALINLIDAMKKDDRERLQHRESK